MSALANIYLLAQLQIQPWITVFLCDPERKYDGKYTGRHKWEIFLSGGKCVSPLKTDTAESSFNFTDAQCLELPNRDL